MEKSTRMVLLVGIVSIVLNASMLLLECVRPARAATLARTPSIVLTGIGSAPSCPSGWTAIVGQTAAGTMTHITGLTYTTETISNGQGGDQAAEDLSSGGSYMAMGNLCGDYGNCYAGGSGVSVPVNTSAATTTYTLYYTVCSQN